MLLELPSAVCISMKENDLKIKFRNPKHHIRVAYRTVGV